MLSELFHLGARLRGLLDEMVHEAWQATLSFWANERWRKFVYSHLALLGITWHHLALLGQVYFCLAVSMANQSDATLGYDGSCSLLLRWESMGLCLVMLNSDPSLFDYAVCARIEPFWQLTPWHRWIANVKMLIPHIYCLCWTPDSGILRSWACDQEKESPQRWFEITSFVARWHLDMGHLEAWGPGMGDHRFWPGPMCLAQFSIWSSTSGSSAEVVSTRHLRSSSHLARLKSGTCRECQGVKGRFVSVASLWTFVNSVLCILMTEENKEN